MDREKVIKALECCIIDPNGLEDCKMNGCPYIKEAEETEEDESLYCQTCLFADVLALLKEQEAMIKPTKCPCGELFDAKDSSFCPRCGCAYGELSGRYTNIGR